MCSNHALLCNHSKGHQDVDMRGPGGVDVTTHQPATPLPPFLPSSLHHQIAHTPQIKPRFNSTRISNISCQNESAFRSVSLAKKAL